MSIVDDPDPLVAYRIGLVPDVPVSTAAEAVAVAERFGFPVAVKLTDGRPDLGEVRLDLGDAAAVERAAADLLGRAGDRAAGVSRGAQVVVQPMVAPGVSCRIEAVEDRSFGPMVGFGPGGVAGDLLGDRAWRAAPLTERDADQLIREPKLSPLLFGYGGAPPVDVVALRELVLRLGLLIDGRPDVRRLVLRPVLAQPGGVAVLHATVHYGQPGDRMDSGPRRLR